MSDGNDGHLDRFGTLPIARSTNSQVMHAVIMASWAVDRSNKGPKITPDLGQTDRPSPRSGWYSCWLRFGNRLPH